MTSSDLVNTLLNFFGLGLGIWFSVFMAHRIWAFFGRLIS